MPTTARAGASPRPAPAPALAPAPAGARWRLLALLLLVATLWPASIVTATPQPRAAASRSWGAVPLRMLDRGTTAGLRPAARAALDRLPRSTRVGLHPGTGQVRFLGGTTRAPLSAATTPGPAAAAGSAALDRTARAFLDQVGPALGLADVRELSTLRVATTPDRARTTVRYRQRRAGIPVLGGELLVTLDRRGRVIAVSGELLPSGDGSPPAPRLSAAAARRVATAWLAREAGVTPGGVATHSEGLVIVDPRLLGSPGPPGPRLAWSVDARATAAGRATDDGLPVHRQVLVDARGGAVLETLDRVAGGVSRTICDFRNKRRADFRCTPGRVTRREGQRPTHRHQVDALYSLLGRLHGFWLTRFGRDGLDGQGQGFVATVRYCLPTWCPMQNAFWEWGPQQVAFGDGWASVDDFVGHEFTHGVLDHEARLFYDFQSGALNESFADIFGEGFDQLDGVGNDKPGVRWLLGEDLRGGAVRSMADPTRFGDADRVRSPRWWSSAKDSGGVHSNSGVGNKAAALIAGGGTFNGHRIRGLGLMAMLRIEYAAMTERLTSAADYLDLHDALIQACLDLAGRAGITVGDCRSVQEAVDATQMDLLPFVGPPRQASVCRGARAPVTVFQDDLEDPDADRWATGVIRGDRQAWHYPQNPNPWPDWDGTWASSGELNLFGQDLGEVNDSAIALTTPVTLPAGAFLRFEHGYRFDSGARDWDGGVLELSADGGPWTDLGPRILESGYTGRIATGRGNPLAGRRAFVGISRGWGASKVDLSPWGGRSVRIRFRIGADRSGGAAGWYVDDIRIYRCAADGDAPVVSVTIGDGSPVVGDPRQVLAITATDATSGVARIRVSNRGAVRGGVLVDGVDLPPTASLPWLLTDTGWGGTTGDGVKRVHVQARDRAGTWSAPVSASVVLDTRAPRVGDPVVRFATGTAIAADEPRIPVRVGFSAVDRGTGVARTELGRLRDAGDWEPLDLGSPAATELAMRLPDDPATAWRFRARAQDGAGRWSPLQATGARRIVSIQDGAAGWSWRGGWRSRADGDAFGPSVHVSDAAGARVTVRSTARAVALVAKRGPGAGIVRVLLDGRVAATVDLYAAAPEPRAIVWAARLSGGRHTIVAAVTGDRNPAASGREVALDALLEVR